MAGLYRIRLVLEQEVKPHPMNKIYWREIDSRQVASVGDRKAAVMFLGAFRRAIRQTLANVGVC